MKLLSVDTELKAITTLCSGPKIIRNKLLSQLDAQDFYYTPAKDTYDRIMSVVRSRGELPSLSEILADPVIPEESRQTLRKRRIAGAKTERTLTTLIGVLHKYRKLRGLYFDAEARMQALKSTSVDVDKLVEDSANALTQIRTRANVDGQLVHFGRGNNSSALIKKLLSNERPEVIPTGFEAFDKRNGGFFPGSLVLLGGSTGGGKSAMANQLLINMTSRGYDSSLVPLEMTAVESGARILANLSGIDVRKFLLGTLSEGERRKAMRATKEWVTKLKELDTRYTIHEPDEDVTIEDVLFTLKPYGYKVIIIDYISLLKGVDGEDSWRQLSNVARFAKIFAKTHNIVVILLVQVSAEGVVRYSRGVVEHSNNCFLWTYTDQNRETGIIDIRQPKARNQEAFGFQLGHDFSTMRIFDVDSNTPPVDRTSAGDKKRKKLDELEDYMRDVCEGDEDEE